MREIKFRIWCMTKKEWEKDLWWLGCEGNLYTPYRNQLKTLRKEHHILEQYTGLKDKNGVEIYEGDVIKYYQPYAKRTDTHIVKWDEIQACFGMFEKDNKWCKESDWIKIQEIEIIGNIHENPELDDYLDIK